MLKKWGQVFFIAIVIVLVLSPLITLFRQKPTLAVAIRTWSMTPLLTRGDLVFIWPAGEKTSFSPGQIVVFGSVEDGIRDWTMHRIVGGDHEKGFITKGDANERTDQEGYFPPIRPEWIAGVVPTLGPLPLKIPLLGYIPLLLEENISNPGILPVFLGILAAALILDELIKKPRKRRKKETLQKGQLYFLGGAAFALLMGALMIMGSVFLTLPYGVEETPGALMGSDVGILEIGASRELILAELKNEGMIPAFYYAVCSDPQVTLENNRFFLRKGGAAEVKATVHAQKEGLYHAGVTVGMFMPFLPTALIAFLADINYWLALIVVSFVPAVPLFVLPFLEPRYRRRTARKWRRRLQRLTGITGL